MNASTLRIAGATADLDTGRILSATGEVTELRPKTVALLRALAARAGSICSKDDLLDQVWPGVHIEEDGLVQCIGEIRRALGPDRSAVRTHPKRGYSLEISDPPAPPAASRPPHRRARMLALALAAMGAVAALSIASVSRQPSSASAFVGPTVAVLPFTPLSKTAQSERLARALTEDVVSDLAQNPWLYVFAESATRELGDPGVPAARALGATYAVTGTIQIERAAARIRVGLVEAPGGRQLWSRTWEGGTGDLLDLQRRASDAIVGELAAAWTGPIARADKARARGRGVDQLAAYELYMRAGERMESYTPDGLAEAEDLLQRAVALEPGFGEAWAKLSLVSYIRLSPEMSRAETEALLEQGHEAALEGLRVAPDRPNVLGQAANVIRWTDPARAEDMIRQAARLAPNNADVLAYLAFRAAHFPALAGEAEAWLDRAIQLNPARPAWYDQNRGAVLMVLGRYGEAAQSYARAPASVDARAGHAAALALSGDRPGAGKALAELRRDWPHFSAAWFAEAAGLHPDVAAVFDRGFSLAEGAAPAGAE